MADSGLFDDDFDIYTIGFTENQYQASAEIISPPPSDVNRAFSSPALDYAERHNRGEEKSFLDHSFNLERQRSRSVSKIHNNILGLVFELTERRKAVTPLSRSMNSADFARPKSSDSGSSSSSLPIIEVQQLPPMSQASKSVPNITHDEDIFSGFPDIFAPTGGLDKKPGNTKKQRRASIQTSAGSSKRFSQPPRGPISDSSYKEPSLYGIVEEAVRRNRQKRADEEEKKKALLKINETQAGNDIKQDGLEKSNGVRLSSDGNKPVTEDENVRNKEPEKSFGVRFSSEEKHSAIVDENVNNDLNVPDNFADDQALEKWKALTDKIIDARNHVRERRPSLFNYRTAIPGPNGGKIKMSYCQSSYQERAEKQRITNIRRRHASQTNCGPLDYNKLRRQILKGGRSATLSF